MMSFRDLCRGRLDHLRQYLFASIRKADLTELVEDGVQCGQMCECREERDWTKRIDGQPLFADCF